MSTGDQTAYLRSKLATRRKMLDYGGPGGQWSSPHFARDGFQHWAESSAPAREGGSEKTPAMKEMPKEKRGGDVISDVSAMVTKMTDFYNQVKEKTPILKTLLRDPTAQKIAKKALGSSIGDVMNDIAKYMEMVGLGHMTHDREMVRRVGGSKSFKEWAKEEAKEHGKGMDPEKMKKLIAMKKYGLAGAGEASWSEHQMDPAMLKKFMAMKGGRIGMGVQHSEDNESQMDPATLKKYIAMMKGGRIGMGEASYGEFRKIGPFVKKHEPEPEPEAEEEHESEGNGVPAEWLNRMKEKARMEGGARGGSVAGALEKAALVHLAKKGSGKAKALLRKCGLTPTGRVRKGGDDETFFQKVTRYAKQVYDFLAENKDDIHDLLESPKFNENLPKAAGGPTQIPKQIASALKMVGLGHRRGRGAAEDARKQIDDQIAALQDQKSKIQASASAVKGKGRRGGAEVVGRMGPSIHDLMAQQFGHYTGMGSDAAYMSGGVGRDDAQQHFGAVYPHNGYKPQARLNNLAPDSAGGWGAEEQNMSKKGGRKPSAYASFVKEYAAKHPGPDLMKRAAAAWRSR